VAKLAIQSETLAAGGRGVSWYKYYQDGYAYSPIDGKGEETLTWRYLQAVNHQLRTLGPIINRLTSTGVFFTTPPPVKNLPLLSGRVVQDIQSTVSPRGFSDVKPPIMVGEFQDEHGHDYVMLVNLSLEWSANIKVSTVTPNKGKQAFSAEDGRLSPLDEDNGHWLLAGHGLLVKFE